MSDQVTAREVAERLIADHTYVSAGGDRVLIGRHGFAEAITDALAAAVAREREIAAEVRFLLDRISEQDWSDATEDFTRDWLGHVEPSIERLRMLLIAAAIRSPETAQAGEATEKETDREAR